MCRYWEELLFEMKLDQVKARGNPYFKQRGAPVNTLRFHPNTAELRPGIFNLADSKSLITSDTIL